MKNEDQDRIKSQPTLADRWIARLKNKKFIALCIIVASVVVAVGQFTNAIQEIRRFFQEFSEPLKVRLSPLIPEPWFHLISPYPPRQGQRPVPMWLMFYASVHNSSGRNIWISSYSISAKTEDGWTQLIQPRQPVSKNTLFFLAALRLQALKPESAFDYNASRAPIAPDGDVSGWMFSESRITKRILKLKVEFYDKDGTVHRREVNAATAQFGAGPPPSGLANLEVPRFDVETGSPLTPELDAYRREMRPYVSLFKMPGSL